MKRSPVVLVLMVLGGLTALCCLGGVVIMGFGLFATDSSSGPQGSPAAVTVAAEGTSAGGFSFTPPEIFAPSGQGRVRAEQKDGQATQWVEVLRLDAISGRDGAEQKLQKLWNEQVARDWNEVKPNPIVMRRFVSNGARCVFTGAEVRSKEGRLAFLTVLLVDADEQLVPLVIIQTHDDPTDLASTKYMFARYSFPKTWPIAEAALAGVKGSPVGLPLVSDDELVGKWVYGTGSQLQWVNTFSGRTGMNTVSYSVDYDFDDDHRYKYKFNGASGTVGSLNFQTDRAEGEWGIKHDVLMLTANGKATEYLLLGAPVSPEGTRLLYLLPKPHWSLFVGTAMGNGELYRPR